MPSKPGERNRRPLPWNEQQLKAVALVFDGTQSLEKIALDCTTPTRTLKDWIAHPDFQAKLQEMREHLLETFDALGVPYIRKEQRLKALAALAASARAEYEQSPKLREYRPVLVRRPADDPNAKPGSMVMVEDYIVTERYNIDAVNTVRNAFADIAAELGARKNVTELTGKDGEALPGLVINVVPTTAANKARYRRQGLSTEPDEPPLEENADGRSSSPS